MRTMLNSVRDRRGNDEGFTLIELMVVVLIIAILIAIAIPTFLGARNSANERAAQSNLRNGLTAAKTVYTDNNSYGTQAGLGTALGNQEPSLTFKAGASAGSKEVSYFTNGSSVALVAKGDGGTCWAIRDTSAGTEYNKSTTACTATTGMLTATGWASSFGDA